MAPRYLSPAGHRRRFQVPVLFPWRSFLGNALLPVDMQRLGHVKLCPSRMELLEPAWLDIAM